MTERIDVNLAFDPETRKAQADFDAYLATRPYQDSNGSVHSPENGQFMSNPNNETEEAYYERMIMSDTTEDQFAGKSLSALAELVRDARANNDRTLEQDAREAFDDKFVELAEKNDWQGTVTRKDGSVENRNEIADRHLAHYEAIMDSSSSEEATSEVAHTNTQPTDGEVNTGATTDALAEGGAEENNTTASTESSDEAEAPAEEIGDTAEDVSAEPEADTDSSFTETDEALENENDDLLENENDGDILENEDDDSALENESDEVLQNENNDEVLQNESGVLESKNDDDVLQNENDDVLQNENDDVLQNERSRWSAIRERFSDAINWPGRKAGSMLAGIKVMRQKENETAEQFEKRKKRNGDIAVGVIAVAAVLYASYRAYNGLSGGSGSLELNGSLKDLGGLGDSESPTIPVESETPTTPTESETPTSPTEPIETPTSEADRLVESFSYQARTVQGGEGGWQTLREMGVDSSDHEKVWEAVGKRLNETGQGDLVYRMDDGRWGWSRAGGLDQKALDTIAQVIVEQR